MRGFLRFAQLPFKEEFPEAKSAVLVTWRLRKPKVELIGVIGPQAPPPWVQANDAPLCACVGWHFSKP